MDNTQEQLVFALNETIRRSELCCARTGDEWLTRVLRAELTQLYKQRRELLGE